MRRFLLRPFGYVILVPLCVVLSAPKSAPPELTNRIENLLQRWEVDEGFWGIAIYDLDAEEMLYSKNAEQSFLPASNQKIITSAAGLEILGSTYRYETVLHYNGSTKGSVMEGDLTLEGSGDPTFGSTQVPGEDPLEVWSERLAEMGVDRIEGRLIGDDNVFDDRPYPNGWTINYITDQKGRYMGNSAGGLSYRDNVVPLSVEATRPGSAPDVEASPSGVVSIDNNATTSARWRGSTLQVNRTFSTNELVLTGSVARAYDGTLAVPVSDPTNFTLKSFENHLQEAGIETDLTLVDVDELDEREVEIETHVEEIQRAQQETVMDKIVRPCRFRILEDHTFRQSSPAVVGVEVMSGTLKRNSNVAKWEDGKPKRVGLLKSIQDEGEDVDELRAGERAAVSIDGPTVGRQIEEGDELWVELPEKHAKILEQELSDEIPADEGAEVTYDRFLDMVHPEDRDDVREARSAHVNGENELDVEYRIERPDGDERIVHERGEVHREDGHPVRLSGTVLDITERKKMERKVRESRMALSEAQKLAQTGHLTIDLVNNAVRLSDECGRLIGLTPTGERTVDDLLGIVHPKDRERVRHAFARMHSEPVHELEYRIEYRSARIVETATGAELARVQHTTDDTVQIDAVVHCNAVYPALNDRLQRHNEVFLNRIHHTLLTALKNRHTPSTR